MPTISDAWNDERKAEAKRLYLIEGRSASQIAKALGGGLTRNAVIGVLARMGATRSLTEATRVKVERAKVERTRQRAAPLPAVKPAPPPPPTERAARADPDAKRTDLVPLLSLPSKGCHWPIKVSDKEDFWFCGRDAVEGKPYCPQHCELAYQPLPPRGVVRRNGAPELARMARNFA